MGPGGIGKTSIALAALHSPEIIERFGDKRFFMSCEATTTVDGIVQELLRTFRLVPPDAKNHIPPRDLLSSHMPTIPNGIICLDNLETVGLAK